MNREILFRGRRIDGSEWVYGYLVKRPSSCQIGSYNPWVIIVPPQDPDDNGGEYWVNPITVGQYTNWSDKNGRRIFEGDIIENHRCHQTYFVFWNEETMTWEMALLGTKITEVNHLINTVTFGESIGLESAWGDPPSYEVIGNIYERNILED